MSLFGNTWTVGGLRYEDIQLHRPEPVEVREVLSAALRKNFASVSVEVTDCPDLTAPEYGLMEKGLGGSPTLLEVGGPSYLLPLVQRSKVYNIKDIAMSTLKGKGKVFAMGAGAGPFPLRSTNCEGIYNFAIGADGTFRNGSYTAKVSGPNEECILEKIPDAEERFALLLNLYVCRGEPGKVIKITCKQRTGDLNFVEAIRMGLKEKYAEKDVGMGGVFVMKRGRAHQHVMRDFSQTPLQSEEDLNNWLKFYEMPARLHAVGTLVTNETEMDLRLQHFHSFSSSNWGGHYHYDTTPEEVEYEAYLNIGERVVRVDRPLDGHKMGRD